MVEPIAVVGAGGFGREVLDLIGDINQRSPTWNVIGVADDGPSDTNLDRLKGHGVPYLGAVAELVAQYQPMAYVIGVGSPPSRRHLASRLDGAGFQAASPLVHPQATIGTASAFGPGSVICAGARVTTNVRAGRHVHIDCNATVGHDTTLGDFVRLNPASSVSGDCVIEADALIGVGATVVNQIAVGQGATVGGNACVIRDVAPWTVVAGVPARPMQARSD